MVGPPVFSGISFQPSDSTEGVCVYAVSVFFFFFCLFHDYKCAPTQKKNKTTKNIMHICVLIYTCANLNGVCLRVGCGQLPRVHRGEVVPDTTRAVYCCPPAWWVCVSTFEVNGSLLGICLLSVTPMVQ